MDVRSVSDPPSGKERSVAKKKSKKKDKKSKKKNKKK